MTDNKNFVIVGLSVLSMVLIWMIVLTSQLYFQPNKIEDCKYGLTHSWYGVYCVRESELDKIGDINSNYDKTRKVDLYYYQVDIDTCLNVYHGMWNQNREMCVTDVSLLNKTESLPVGDCHSNADGTCFDQEGNMFFRIDVSGLPRPKIDFDAINGVNQQIVRLCDDGVFTDCKYSESQGYRQACHYSIGLNGTASQWQCGSVPMNSTDIHLGDSSSQ